MIFNRALLASAVVVSASAVFAGCSLPPVTTSEQSLTIPYGNFLPGNLSASIGVPVVVPAFNDRQAPPTTIPVPKEAKGVNLSSVTLNLKVRNTGDVPLRVKLFLSGEGTDPYTTPALGGDQALIDLPANSPEVTKNFSIDPTLFRNNDNLKLGYTFGSDGTNGPVSLGADDAVIVKHSVSASVKLF